MENHTEEYLKSLDALEALLERHKDFYGEVQKILEAFKKEISEDMTFPQIQKLLNDLTKLGSVYEIPQNHNSVSKYQLIKKHPIGHYQEALNKEIENLKTKEIQLEKEKKISDKLDLDLIQAKR